MALFAEGILKLHWDQSVPVNLARIAKKMGVAVALSDSLEACVCIDISAHNHARITIGTRHPLLSQRYGVAQALAHLFHVPPSFIKQRLADLDLRLAKTLALQVNRLLLE